MTQIKNKFVFFGMSICVIVLSIIFLSYDVYTKKKNWVSLEKQMQKEQEKVDSLECVSTELEKKIEILNRYLVLKHIEYIDECPTQKYERK